MASITLQVGAEYATGTSVSVYNTTNSVPGAPVGGVVTTAVVGSDGTVTFSGLTGGLNYLTYAASGTPQYVRFYVPVPAATGSTGTGVVLPWATGTVYVTGQPVTNGGKTWLAVDDHTAGATFSGDSAHWTLLPVSSSSAVDRGTFAGSTAYAVGDIYTYRGARFQVITAYTSSSTPDFTKVVPLDAIDVSSAPSDLQVATYDAASGKYRPAATANAPALLGAAGALKLFGDRIPLARSSVFQDDGTGGTFSNGTDTGFNSITHHELVGVKAGLDYVVAYYHRKDATGALTLKAALQSPTGGGQYVYPLTFRGASSVTLQPGQWVASDPVYGMDQVASGMYPTPSGPPFTRPGILSGYAHVLVRTYGTVSAGSTWAKGMIAYGLSSEGYESGTSITDKTASGSVAAASAGTAVFGPAAVMATLRTHQPVIGALGDSIAGGKGDTSGGGFIERAGLSLSPPVSTLKMAQGGSKNPYMRGGSGGSSDQYKQVLPFLIGASHVVLEAGINFIFGGATPTAASVQEAMWEDWTLLTDMGIKVFQTTLMPYTTSTDSWATTGNQTVTVGESVRTTINDWIRTTPSPLTGFIEVADTVESSRNSGKWKASYTADGLHPNPTGHVAAAVPVATAMGAFSVA